MQAYDVLPYFGAKLAAELPVGAVFPLLFCSVLQEPLPMQCCVLSQRKSCNI